MRNECTEKTCFEFEYPLQNVGKKKIFFENIFPGSQTPQASICGPHQAGMERFPLMVASQSH